jgi:putative Ig domain-containing protein
MRHSDFPGPWRARRLAICGFALAAFLAGATAHANPKVPHISGTPATTDVAGQAYSFTPSANGPRGATLTFSITNQPAWAAFNATTGTLSGTPTSADIGTFANIGISVSDGSATASLAPFSITVSAPTSANTAPTISGAPPTTATAGTLYTFTPTASDTDGDAISFSIQNKPVWATFSIATGSVSGTPNTTDVGTDSNIVISVSDGYTTASLAPFAITVSQPATSTSGTATLSWTAPTTNTDGSALTDLAGYHIYYGTSPSTMTTVIDVANPGAVSYSVSSLSSATWYFAVNAYTTSGLESTLSTTVSKSIP